MQLDPNNIPRHVAIIMDGNGRWAQQKGLPRIKGHEAGAESVRAAVRACRDLNIEYLTLYAFSVENWVRPAKEIQALMRLLRTFLVDNEYELHENEVRFRAIGRLDDLPGMVQRHIKRVMKSTAHYTKGTLTLALSYGGRAEIVDAARQMAEKVQQGTLQPKEIDEKTLAEHLYAPDIPDPELMIRTSGELRLSNFLLWQLSYAEFYITDTYWPDFREQHLVQAIQDYQNRSRRFGGLTS